MKQLLFDVEIAAICEQAVMEVFECKKENIFCSKDTFWKKVVVFVLYHFYDFDNKYIGRWYSINWLYVPTVAEIMKFKGKNERVFNYEVNQVLKIMGYGA